MLDPFNPSPFERRGLDRGARKWTRAIAMGVEPSPSDAFVIRYAVAVSLGRLFERLAALLFLVEVVHG